MSYVVDLARVCETADVILKGEHRALRCGFWKQHLLLTVIHGRR